MADEPTDPDDHQATRPRGGDGRFVPKPETAERDAEAARLRGRGMSFRAIAAEMGYESHTSVMDAVRRALDAIRAEPAADVRALELERLDRMYEAVVGVLEREHVTVSNGKVIYVGEEPLKDDDPVLRAVDRLLKIQERRARLLGLDAEQKVNMSGGLTVEIVGVSEEDL